MISRMFTSRFCILPPSPPRLLCAACAAGGMRSLIIIKATFYFLGYTDEIASKIIYFGEYCRVIDLAIVGCIPIFKAVYHHEIKDCLLYTSPSPRDRQKSRMPSS